MPKELLSKLNQIQVNLDAKKSKTNKFGGYQYRSAEDILEALKPHLEETKCVLTITDEVVEIGGRIYVKATATLMYGDELTTSTAFAREAESKKGYDESQITGSASSYARKYALCGLFAIDDGVDADSTNKGETKEDAIKALTKAKDQAELSSLWERYGAAYGNDNDFRTAYMKRMAAIQNGG